VLGDRLGDRVVPRDRRPFSAVGQLCQLTRACSEIHFVMP